MSLALHEISEADHRILNPFTEEKLMTLGAVSRVGPSTRILDLACGKGELLCRWAQAFGARTTHSGARPTSSRRWPACTTGSKRRERTWWRWCSPTVQLGSLRRRPVVDSHPMAAGQP